MRRLGVLATSLTGLRPTGLGVYTQAILENTPWPEDAVLLADADVRARCWSGRPSAETPTLTGLAPRLLWQLTRLDTVARQNGCALLYSPTHELSPSVSIPTVLVVHDLIPLLFPQLTSRKLSGFFAHLLPRACAKAAAIVAVSESTRRDLVHHYGLEPRRITVIPNGYDQRLFRPPDAAEVGRWKVRRGLGEYVLYVGRLSGPKNVGALVEGFAAAAASVPHDLVLVGPDEKGERARLAELARRLGLDARLKFLDYVPATELPLAYGGAALFVTPSLYEGFGLPPLEAMACGTPVLVADNSSLPEVVGSAGLRFDPSDAAKLGALIAELLHAPQRRAQLRALGLERATQFSWARTGQLTRELLDRVAAT